MSEEKKITIHIDPKEQQVPEKSPEVCPTCGAGPEEWDSGYGLAGGGMGVYMFCTRCGDIISKSQTE